MDREQSEPLKKLTGGRLSPQKLKQNQDKRTNFMLPVSGSDAEIMAAIDEEADPIDDNAQLINKYFGIDTDLLKRNQRKLQRQQIQSSRTELFFSSQNLIEQNPDPIHKQAKEDSASETAKHLSKQNLGDDSSRVSSSHQRILQRALELHKKQQYSRVKADIQNQRLAKRSLHIINENKEFRDVPRKNEDLNRQIKRF